MKKSLHFTAKIASIVFIVGGIFVYNFYYLFASPMAPFTGRYKRGDVSAQSLQNAIAMHNVNIINTYHILGILLIFFGYISGNICFKP